MFKTAKPIFRKRTLQGMISARSFFLNFSTSSVLQQMLIIIKLYQHKTFCFRLVFNGGNTCVVGNGGCSNAFAASKLLHKMSQQTAMSHNRGITCKLGFDLLPCLTAALIDLVNALSLRRRCFCRMGPPCLIQGSVIS